MSLHGQSFLPSRGLRSLDLRWEASELSNNRIPVLVVIGERGQVTEYQIMGLGGSDPTSGARLEALHQDPRDIVPSRNPWAPKP
jgi:hypothetical protein